MALHPDKLRAAHEELDRLVGTDRLPTIADRPNLPYIDAVIKETMRWHPALPLGMPYPPVSSRLLQWLSACGHVGLARCTAQSDVYEGYTIPKGTIVIPNAWCV